MRTYGERWPIGDVPHVATAVEDALRGWPFGVQRPNGVCRFGLDDACRMPVGFARTVQDAWSPGLYRNGVWTTFEPRNGSVKSSKKWNSKKRNPNQSSRSSNVPTWISRSWFWSGLFLNFFALFNCPAYLTAANWNGKLCGRHCSVGKDSKECVIQSVFYTLCATCACVTLVIARTARLESLSDGGSFGRRLRWILFKKTFGGLLYFRS